MTEPRNQGPTMAEVVQHCIRERMYKAEELGRAMYQYGTILNWEHGLREGWRSILSEANSQEGLVSLQAAIKTMRAYRQHQRHTKALAERAQRKEKQHNGGPGTAKGI